MSQEEGLDFWKVSRLERVDWESLGLMLRRAMRLAKRSDERSEVMSEANRRKGSDDRVRLMASHLTLSSITSTL